jgi:hypothetical protein
VLANLQLRRGDTEVPHIGQSAAHTRANTKPQMNTNVQWAFQRPSYYRLYSRFRLEMGQMKAAKSPDPSAFELTIRLSATVKETIQTYAVANLKKGFLCARSVT